MNTPLECPLWWAIQYAATEPWRYPSRNTPAGDEIRATHHVLEGAWPVTTALYDLELVIPTLAEDIMIDKRIWDPIGGLADPERADARLGRAVARGTGGSRPGRAQPRGRHLRARQHRSPAPARDPRPASVEAHMNAKSLWCDLDPVGSPLFNDVWNKTPEDFVYLVGGPVFSGHWWATPGSVSDLIDRYIADLVEGS